MLKRFIAAVISLALILCSLPENISVHAEEVHEHDGITFTAWDKDDSLPSSSGSFYLTKDVTLTDQWRPDGKTVNLCLNGHVIKQTSGSNLPAINVLWDAKVYLYDCDGHTTEHYFDVDPDTGLWVLTDTKNETSKIVRGGVITGGRNAGVQISSGGAGFSMYGGNIVGNQSTYYAPGGLGLNRSLDFVIRDVNILGNVSNTVGGGAQTVDHSTTLFDNCIIAYNRSLGTDSTYGGGGIYSYGGNVTLKDCQIYGNKSATDGGGIFTYDSWSCAGLHIEGDTVISGNYAARYGGGVYNSYSVANAGIDGGTITGNAAGSAGGGVFDYSVNAAVGGTAVVSGNLVGVTVNADGSFSGGTASDFYVRTGQTIKIGTKTSEDEGNGVKVPAEGMNVGLFCEKEVTAAVPVAFADAAADYSAYMFPNSAAYSVEYDSENGKMRFTKDSAVKTVSDLMSMITGSVGSAVPVDIKLGADIICDNTIAIPAEANVHIDLNGHTIDRGLSEAAYGVSNGSVITVGNNAKVILENGTITGGCAEEGGGLLVHQLTTGYSVTLKNVTFTGNRAMGRSDDLRYCSGGAVYLGNSGHAEILGCTFTDNSSDGDGGAVTARTDITIGSLPVEGGTPIRTRFEGNTQDSELIIVMKVAESAAVTITDTDFVDNSSNRGCAGIRINAPGSDHYFENCTWSGNSTGEKDGCVIIRSRSGSHVTVKDCVFENIDSSACGADDICGIIEVSSDNAADTEPVLVLDGCTFNDNTCGAGNYTVCASGGRIKLKGNSSYEGGLRIFAANVEAGEEDTAYMLPVLDVSDNGDNPIAISYNTNDFYSNYQGFRSLGADGALLILDNPGTASYTLSGNIGQFVPVESGGKLYFVSREAGNKFSDDGSVMSVSISDEAAAAGPSFRWYKAELKDTTVTDDNTINDTVSFIDLAMGEMFAEYVGTSELAPYFDATMTWTSFPKAYYGYVLSVFDGPEVPVYVGPGIALSAGGRFSGKLTGLPEGAEVYAVNKTALAYTPNPRGVLFNSISEEHPSMSSEDVTSEINEIMGMAEFYAKYANPAVCRELTLDTDGSFEFEAPCEDNYLIMIRVEDASASSLSAVLSDFRAMLLDTEHAEALEGKTAATLNAADLLRGCAYGCRITFPALTMASFEQPAINSSFLFVGKESVVIEASANDIVYGSDGLILSGITVKDGDGNPIASLTAESLKYSYESTDDGNYAGADAPVDAGEYKVCISVPDTNIMYRGELTLTFSITPAELTVKANDKQILTGDSAANAGAVFTGLVDPDEEALLAKQLIYTYGTYVSGSAAGTYPIVPEGLTTHNYTITYQPGVLTVTDPEIGDNNLTLQITGQREGTINIDIVNEDGEIFSSVGVTTEWNGEMYVGIATIPDMPDAPCNMILTQTTPEGRTITRTEMIIPGECEGVYESEIPEGEANSVVTVTGDTPMKVVAGGLNDEVDYIAGSDSEELVITLEMLIAHQDEVDTDTETAEAIEMIKELLPDGAEAEYINIDLLLKIQTIIDGVIDEEDTMSENIAESHNLMKIVFMYDFAGKKNVTVYRAHGSGDDLEAYPLTRITSLADAADGCVFIDEANGLIYIFSTQFSTYAIGYENASVTPPHHDPGPGPAPIIVTVERINVPEDEREFTLTEIGSRKKIDITVEPAHAPTGSLKWTSSDENVAVVDRYGNVTAVGSGTAVITVSASEGGAHTEITVIVEAGDEEEPGTEDGTGTEPGTETESGDEDGAETEDGTETEPGTATESGDEGGAETGDGTGGEADSEPAVRQIYEGFGGKAGKRSIILNWGQVDGADGYKIYYKYCGRSEYEVTDITNPDKNAAVIRRVEGRPFDTRKVLNVYVEAYRYENGTAVTIDKTIHIHVAGIRNSEHTNPAEISVTKDMIALPIGRKEQLSAAIVALYDEDKKLLGKGHGRTIRFRTSDSSVAKVNKYGKVTAVGRGSCYIYVIGINGICTKVQITVK